LRSCTAEPRLIWLAPDRFDVKPDKGTWLEMSHCLRELGWRVTILTGRKESGGETEQNFDGLVEYVQAIDVPFVFRISLLRSMGRWLKRNARPEDVIVMNEDALWLVPQLRRLGVRFVHLDFRTLPVDIHRWKRRLDWLLFWRLAVKRFGRKVDGYSFITERLRREVEAEFELGAGDYVIWQSGVNLDRFKANVSKEGRADGAFQLFYHGSISRKRGLGIVLEAIALGELPADFEFVILGDGPERCDLEQQARELGVEHQVRFLGFVPYERVVDELAQADVCICPLPDRLEWNVSSPLKVFEYMACAKPMILTPIPAHTDVLGDARFVVWTHGFEPDDFKRAILEASARRSEISLAAREAPQLVRERHEWRVQAENFHRYLSRGPMPNLVDGSIVPKAPRGRVAVNMVLPASVIVSPLAQWQ
jgi:glycosyltransferase involved in cell wall biosynthesis